MNEQSHPNRTAGQAGRVVVAVLIVGLCAALVVFVSGGWNEPDVPDAPDIGLAPSEEEDGGELDIEVEATHGWGAQPNASWPSNCLIEDAGLQPGVPLFAIGCNDPDDYDFGGHIVVFDANTGAVLTSTHLDNLSVGFEGGYNIKFDAERTQLGTNSGTSGIAAIDRNGEFIGQAFPDETRDHAVDYTWVDHRIFTDTSNFFEIKRGDRRFDFEPSGPPWFVTPIWNATAGLVVGTERLSHPVKTSDGRDTIRWTSDLVALDPSTNEPGYRIELQPRESRTEWSPDGRRVAVWHWEIETDTKVRIFDGDDGTEVTEVDLGYDIQIDVGPFGPGDRLLVRTSKWLKESREWERKLLLVHEGKIVWSVPQVGRHNRFDFSPSGHRVAYFADEQLVIRRTDTGAVTKSFKASAPTKPAGLPDWYGGEEPGNLRWVTDERIAQFEGHFLRFWSPKGELVFEQVMPMK